MGLFGNFNTMSLEELLLWVQAGAKTGTLEVERGKICKRIMFEDGQVVACSSDDPATLLGQFLLSRGTITEETLRDALARQQHAPKNLGQILGEMGAITPEDGARFVEAKIEETIYGLFDWSEAVFRFETDAALDPHAIDVDLDVREILDRGRQRHNELKQSQEILDDPSIVLRRAEGADPPPLSGNRAAARIFELIDGKRSIADILLQSHAPEFLVSKFLTALLKGGVVEITGVRQQPEPAAVDSHGIDCPAWSFGGKTEPEPEPEPEPKVEPEVELEPEPEAVVLPELEPAAAAAVQPDINVAFQLMSNGQPEAALELLNAMLEAFPSDGALRHLVDNAESEFRASMIAGELALTRVPVPGQNVEQSVSPEESFLQGLIDGNNDIRAILWLAPMREVEVLKVLRGMVKKGLIEVREPATA